MATVDRGWKVDSCFKNWHFYGTWPTRFHTWFLLSSRKRFFRPKSGQKTGSGKDDTKNDDIYNRLHSNISCRLRQLRTTASGWRRCWRTGAWRTRSGWRSWRTLKTTTFIIVFTTIFPQAATAADDSERMKKVLENRSLEDEKRMAQQEDAKNDDIYNRLHNNFSAGRDSCGRQRADEEGAREPEPGGREAYGAAGRH